MIPAFRRLSMDIHARWPQFMITRKGPVAAIGIVFIVALAMLVVVGCMEQRDDEVVVYSALDREFSEPILNDLERELGFRIRTKFDQESNKTVGLANEIIQTQQRPTADIFWNNEILHTYRLQRAGRLEVYHPPAGERFPEGFRSATGHWSGFAARARVLIVNTDRIPDPADYPDSFLDLADPAWRGQCAIARPVFGTTATHAAVLWSQHGPAAARQLWQRIADNGTLVAGNKQVAQGVAAGDFAFGITDTDDAMVEWEQANPVVLVFPDQGDQQPGTLLIPNTLAIVKRGPHPDLARKLVNRLLQPDIEQRLASGPSAQLPLGSGPSASADWRVREASTLGDQPLKRMDADFEQAAEAWEDAKAFLSKL